MFDLEATRLWKAFYAKGNDAQRETVRKLATRAADRLDLVRDTFPTYTLHNRTHSINVIERMADLFGVSLEKLTALEGAILILSAYCHDIGMVFDEDERANIKNENSFARFLSKYPEARIEIEKGGGISVDVAEWYCRWIHPDRVYEFLKTLPKEAISWGLIPIGEKLGAVCCSHGYDAEELIDDKKFTINFLGEADLRFCAILLRLGDILDFDNTRAPDEVYEYLGIAKRKTPRAETSDVEWKKHLVAGGFSFPEDRLSEQYEVRFSANPDHPAVEYDVRQFLNVIEREIQKCASILKYCSKKWQDFKLPSGFNRDDIVSSGYKYGEYRFTLEQNRILELLMGENLYDDPYAFVRELLQNAIDTTRHRVYFERSKGNTDYEPGPVEVATWFDKDNYQWVRIDDSGMGMDESIIVKYFLKIGESYYQSAQFSAQVLSYPNRDQPRFVPISRFGIGVLSCFILGDRVEISTRHIDNDKSEPFSIRLSLSGLHSFYVLQSERDKHYEASEMPGRIPEQRVSYRKAGNYGTSVAVRLDPQKEKTRLNLKQVLENYVLLSPVPVKFEGETIGGNADELIGKPWAEGIVEEELTAAQMAEIESVFDFKFEKRIRIRVVPLDLTQHSPTRNLKGQALVGYLLIDDADNEKIEELSRGRHYDDRVDASISMKLDPGDVTALTLRATYSNPEGQKQLELKREEFERRHYELREKLATPGSTEHAREMEEELRNNEEWLHGFHVERRSMEREVRIDISHILSKLATSTLQTPEQTLHNGDRWLSHNGIAVPLKLATSDYAASLSINGNGNSQSKYWVRQTIALSDALRPDVSLSRDRLRNLSWNIYSATTLAFRRALTGCNDASSPLDDSNIFSRILGKETFLLGNILTDPLIETEEEWAKQDIIQTNRGPQSVESIRSGLAHGESFEISSLPNIDDFFHRSYGSSFVQTCAATLVQIRINVSLKIDDRKAVVFSASSGEPLVSRGQYLFPPLFFVPYQESKLLRFDDFPLNQNHAFAQWLINNSEAIDNKYPGIFKSIRERISREMMYEKKTFEQNLLELNEILERLWELDESLRPETKINLTINDFKRAYGW